MARPRYPKHSGPPPPPLPPIARTVGQVVAEALKLYGTRFVSCLVLGLPLALAGPLAFGQPFERRILVMALLAPLFALAYAEACTIEGAARPPWRCWAVSLMLGSVVFAVGAAMPYAIFTVIWFGLIGWVVPVAVHEQLGVVASLRRALALARADLAHAIGGIATLVLVFGLTRGGLVWLLREQADNTVKTSVFLADLVISPVIFLGSAILYRDLVARVGTTRTERLQARAEAMAQLTP